MLQTIVADNQFAPAVIPSSKVDVKLTLRSCVLATFGCRLLIVFLTGCTRTVNVTKQMTWECAPEEYKSAFRARPDEYVRFRFVEEPRCFDVESAKNLCAEMRSIDKPVVSVDFQVWGGPRPLNFPLSREGYNIVAVEGRALTDKGGWAHNGSNGFNGVCPIGKVIADLDGYRQSKR